MHERAAILFDSVMEWGVGEDSPRVDGRILPDVERAAAPGWRNESAQTRRRFFLYRKEPACFGVARRRARSARSRSAAGGVLLLSRRSTPNERRRGRRSCAVRRLPAGLSVPPSCRRGRARLRAPRSGSPYPGGRGGRSPFRAQSGLRSAPEASEIPRGTGRANPRTRSCTGCRASPGVPRPDRLP
jgi:hypothetical protein